MTTTPTRRRPRRRAVADLSILLAGGLAVTGCSAVIGASDFVTELAGGEVTKKVVDANGVEYVILKGQPTGESIGDSDSNYRRNVQFPEGLPEEVQQWSEQDVEGFYEELKNAEMVDTATVTDDNAEDVANAVARATTAMNQGLVDTQWLGVNVTDEQISDLTLSAGVPDDRVDHILERTLLGWNPENTSAEQEFVVPPLVHDGWNRFAQTVNEEGEPVAPLGEFTVQKNPEYCERCYTVTFPEVQYFFRVNPDTYYDYTAWVQENLPQSEWLVTERGDEVTEVLISYTAKYKLTVEADDDWVTEEQTNSYHYASGWWLNTAGYESSFKTIPVRDE